ncbi:hypothetical protein H310_13369 [Aphanomyces invadans]|uniref:Uncharacterized protein n=1 Tax=Aphanomyces invadans TaxID=157072 RepID=A0A024TDT7_9STRA|nr:hypothetical protein H310_13369 [Aphanomyces invadans]ETV92315.1 hypothetical protein H310_13369 [Aphanomyces invadans]|eukprot:XP_008879066.1 hypothetical protein H310_13369 [Aphanomyces invadans]
MLADFYEKLEQLDVAHLPEQEPKQQLYKTDVRLFCRVTLMDNFMLFESQMLVAEKKQDTVPPRQYGDKATRYVPTKNRDGVATTRASTTNSVAALSEKGCLKCGSDEHWVLRSSKVQPASEKRDDAKRKIIGAAVDIQDALVIDCPCTVACDVNGVTALALLDNGAVQSVVSPTFLARGESVGSFALAVRQLDRSIEFGCFMEAMKLAVDREVNLRLTFDTAEGTLVLANLKCWVAAMPLQDG